MPEKALATPVKYGIISQSFISEHSPMSTLDFSTINKHSQRAFKAQHNMIKNIAKGATILCDKCQNPLQLTTPITGQKETSTGVRCRKGCTAIELEFV